MSVSLHPKSIWGAWYSRWQWGDGAAGECLNHKDINLRDGISALIKVSDKIPPHASMKWGHVEVTLWNTESLPRTYNILSISPGFKIVESSASPFFFNIAKEQNLQKDKKSKWYRNETEGGKSRLAFKWNAQFCRKSESINQIPPRTEDW